MPSILRTGFLLASAIVVASTALAGPRTVVVDEDQANKKGEGVLKLCIERDGSEDEVEQRLRRHLDLTQGAEIESIEVEDRVVRIGYRKATPESTVEGLMAEARAIDCDLCECGYARRGEEGHGPSDREGEGKIDICLDNRGIEEEELLERLKRNLHLTQNAEIRAIDAEADTLHLDFEAADPNETVVATLRPVSVLSESANADGRGRFLLCADRQTNREALEQRVRGELELSAGKVRSIEVEGRLVRVNFEKAPSGAEVEAQVPSDLAFGCGLCECALAAAPASPSAVGGLGAGAVVGGSVAGLAAGSSAGGAATRASRPSAPAAGSTSAGLANAAATGDAACLWEAPTDSSGGALIRMPFDRIKDCQLVMDELVGALQVTNGAAIRSITEASDVSEQCVANVEVVDGPPSANVQACLPEELSDGLTPGSSVRVQRRFLWLAPLGSLGILAGGDDDDGSGGETVGSPGQ